MIARLPLKARIDFAVKNQLDESLKTAYYYSGIKTKIVKVADNPDYVFIEDVVNDVISDVVGDSRFFEIFPLLDQIKSFFFVKRADKPKDESKTFHEWHLYILE